MCYAAGIDLTEGRGCSSEKSLSEKKKKKEAIGKGRHTRKTTVSSRVKTTKTEKSRQQVPWSKSIASSSFCPRHSIAEKERKKKCMIPSCLLITFSRSYANVWNEWSLQFRPS